MLASFYQQFVETLHRDKLIAQSNWRTYAGQRFLYVNSPLPASVLTKQLLEAAERLSYGTRLKPECIYVRSAENWHVYRFRFRVPDEKQFCCGNLCEDCFLHRVSATPAPNK